MSAVPVALGPKARPHEWISFDDPEEVRTWVFDATFLLSRYTCIFGRGCQGVLTAAAPELVQGCCSYGAHATDAEDEAEVDAYAARLTAEQWQFKGRKKQLWQTNADGDRITQQVDDACVFLNRPDFDRGAGCALHVGALDAGERPMDWKPNVCWQVPVRREDDTLADGRIVSTIKQWDRVHWGEGGAEFHWWCTEAPEAFVADDLLYRTMRDELVELSNPFAYAMAAGWCDARLAGAPPLPHPAEASVATPVRRARKRAQA